MARLEDLRQGFTQLSWQEKVQFIIDYRTKRHNDLNTVQEFDLSKKTKSTKVREKKEPSVKRVKADKQKFTPEQIALLKQLGLC